MGQALQRKVTLTSCFRRKCALISEDLHFTNLEKSPPIPFGSYLYFPTLSVWLVNCWKTEISVKYIVQKYSDDRFLWCFFFCSAQDGIHRRWKNVGCERWLLSLHAMLLMLTVMGPVENRWVGLGRLKNRGSSSLSSLMTNVYLTDPWLKKIIFDVWQGFHDRLLFFFFFITLSTC